MSVKKVFASILLGMFLLAFGAVAPAQENRGGITGTVQDSSGAVVPGVSITAIDVAQGVIYPATSTSAGVMSYPT